MVIGWYLWRSYCYPFVSQVNFFLIKICEDFYLYSLHLRKLFFEIISLFLNTYMSCRLIFSQKVKKHLMLIRQEPLFLTFIKPMFLIFPNLLRSTELVKLIFMFRTDVWFVLNDRFSKVFIQNVFCIYLSFP
jgi:hypothetical protein